MNTLRNGGLVQINAVSNSDAPVSIPLFANRIPMAPGAPRIALRAGARIFGVVAAGPEKEYCFKVKFVPLDSSVHMPATTTDRIQPDVDRIVKQFGNLLESSMAERPGLFPLLNLQFQPE
jgi:hypothetical protein